jgi:hypothetical protein
MITVTTYNADAATAHARIVSSLGSRTTPEKGGDRTRSTLPAAVLADNPAHRHQCRGSIVGYGLW